MMEYKIKYKILILKYYFYIKSGWRFINSWLKKIKNINIEIIIFIVGYCILKNWYIVNVKRLY